MELVITAYLAIGYGICISLLHGIPDGDRAAIVHYNGALLSAVGLVLAMLAYTVAWPFRRLWTG